MDRLALIDRIEAVIHEDVGRNVLPLFAASRGGLRGAVETLVAKGGPVGLITGFFVPGGAPPSAETDGPPGAALIARGLRAIGIETRLCTDAPCADACSAALAAAGLSDSPLDVVSAAVSVPDVVSAWRDAGVRTALAIERCGRTHDGAARNMRGESVGAFTTLLDDLFLAGPWKTIAIGDGGNEVGMGSMPPGLIAAHVANGASIACATPADHLIVAGVSHWGAYALLGGLAIWRDEWRPAMLDCLDPALDRAIIEATVRDGPAVDGVTGARTPTIDAVAGATHERVLLKIRDLAAGMSGAAGMG